MDYRQMKAARKRLSLSISQMAEMMETDPQTIRRIEMDPSRSTSRPPAPRMARLITAYLLGYRPTDWPIRETDCPDCLAGYTVQDQPCPSCDGMGLKPMEKTNG